MAVGNEVAPDAGTAVTVAKGPGGAPAALAVDADGKLLVAGITSGGGGGGGGGDVVVDFSATNALLGQIKTATQALLGADSPLPAAQLTALTSAISAAQTAIVAAQGGTATATQSVLSALGPLQTAVVAVQAAVAAAGSGAHTDSVAEQVALAGLGSKLDVLTTTVAALQSSLSVTLKPQTIADLSSAIQSQLAPLFSSIVTAVQAGGADGTATVAALQAISAKLTSGTGAQALDLAPLVAALRADEAAAAAAAHTDAAAILGAALRTATKLEAGLSLTSPVTLDSASIAALTGPLAALSTIATQTQGLATAAGQASALTALQAIQTAVQGGATSAQQAAILTSLSASGDIVTQLKTLGTAAGQASALAVLQDIRTASQAGTLDLDAIKASAAAGATSAGQAQALVQLTAIAGSVAAGATASGQASALTALQALKTSTDAITTRLGQVLSVADSRMTFDGSGRLTIAVGDVGLGATAAKQDTAITAITNLGGGKTLADIVNASGGGTEFEAYVLGPTNGTTVTKALARSNGTLLVGMTSQNSSSTWLIEFGSGSSNDYSISPSGTTANNNTGAPISIGKTLTPNSAAPSLTRWFKFDATGINKLSIRNLSNASNDVFVIIGVKAPSGIVTIPDSLTVNLGSSGVGGSATNPLFVAIQAQIIRNVLTTATLAAGGKFTSAAIDCGQGAGANAQLIARTNADQSATMVVKDGSTTTQTAHVAASAPLSVGVDTTAGPTRYVGYAEQRYASVEVTNGGTALGRLLVLFDLVPR